MSNIAHFQTKTYVLVAVFGVLAGISRNLGKQLGKSAYLSRIGWFDFGSALMLIAAIYSHPLIALGFMVLSELAGRPWIGKGNNRIEASVANTVSDFTTITLIVCAIRFVLGADYINELQPTFAIIALFGGAAFLHEVGTSVLNPLMFTIIDGKTIGPKVTKVFREERKRHAVLCAGYVLLTMAISSVYLFSNVVVTLICASALIGCVFFLCLWIQARDELNGEYQPSWMIISQQFRSPDSKFEQNVHHQSRVSIITNRPDEPAWNLAGMAFKILHTNQDRFVRHSIATGRLCEYVASELQVTIPDVDPEEAWVVGVLHDVGLMDQPRQVLRFAERVERPIDLEVYGEGKSGERTHLSLEDRRLPEVTFEDTDVLDKHPEIGAKLLAAWPNVAEVVALHHKLSFEYDQLPLLAQILFVCEKYELLASKDGFCTAVSKDEALNALKEEYEILLEHPQVLNTLTMILDTRDESFWNATDLDYDQEVQLIASRLQAYATKHTTPQTTGKQTKTSPRRFFDPLAPKPHPDSPA